MPLLSTSQISLFSINTNYGKKNFAENKNYVKPYLTLFDFHGNWNEAKVYCVDRWVKKLLNSSNFWGVESNLSKKSEVLEIDENQRKTHFQMTRKRKNALIARIFEIFAWSFSCYLLSMSPKCSKNSMNVRAFFEWFYGMRISPSIKR